MNEGDDLSVLVVGGTGRQGGSVVRRLLSETDYTVSVLTRRPEGKQARALAQRGVSVTKGDLFQVNTLEEAFRGVDRVFFITDYATGTEPVAEQRQGKNVVDAAEASNVDHLVFSSTIDVDLARGVPHFAAKAIVERQVLNADVDSTIVRPAPFYQNIELFVTPIQAGVLPFPIDTDAVLPMVDVRDIGAVVTSIIMAPKNHRGSIYPVIGGRYTLIELADMMSSELGYQVSPVSFPGWLIERLEDKSIRAMFEWFSRYGQIRGRTSDRFELDYMEFGTYFSDNLLPEPGLFGEIYRHLTVPFRQLIAISNSDIT